MAEKMDSQEERRISEERIDPVLCGTFFLWVLLAIFLLVNSAVSHNLPSP